MFEVNIFRRKTFFVTAVQVTKENMSDVAEWCNGTLTQKGDNSFIKVNVKRALSRRQTEAHVDDWVLSNGVGFKVYTPTAFANNFELDEGSEYNIQGVISTTVGVVPNKLTEVPNKE